MPDGGSINVKITAEAAGFNSGVNQAAQALANLQAAANQAAGSINQAGQSITTASQSISTSASHASTAAKNLHSSASGLRGVFHEASEGAKTAGESIRGLWENVERGVAVLGVGLGIKEIISQLKELAEGAEHTENVAASLGIDVGEYSKLSGAMQLVGLNADTARRSLITLQTKMVEASEAPGKARSAMLSLGYSLGDIRRSSEDAVFAISRISQAIAQFASSPTKTADLRELLGARGMEALIAAAKDGPAALAALEQKWIELSGQTKEAIEHLAETAKIINEVDAAFTGLKTAIYENFHEPINQAIKTLKEFIVHLHDSPAAMQGLIDAVDRLAGAAAGFVAGGFVGGPIGAIAGAAVGAASGVSGITAAVKELKSESDQTFDAWHAFATWWDNLQEAMGHGRPSGTTRPPPDYTTKLPGGGASAPLPPKPLPNDQTTKLPADEQGNRGASAPIPPLSFEQFYGLPPAESEKKPLVAPQPNIAKEKEDLDLQKKLIDDRLKVQLADYAWEIAAAKGHADQIAAIEQQKIRAQQQALADTNALVEKKKADFRALYTDEETLAKIIGGTVDPGTGKATQDTSAQEVERVHLETEALKQQQAAREELIKAEMREADVLASADQARLRVASIRTEEGAQSGHAGKLEALQAETQLTAQYAAQEIARYQAIAEAADTSTEDRIAAYDKIAHIAEQTAEKEEELAKQVAEAQKKAAEEAAKVFTEFFKGAESALDSFIEASILGGKNRADALRNLYEGLTKDVVKTITNLGSQLAAQGLANVTGQKLEPGKGIGDLLGQMVGQLFGLGGGKDQTQLAAQNKANEFLSQIDKTLNRIEALTKQKTDEARAAIGGAATPGAGAPGAPAAGTGNMAGPWASEEEAAAGGGMAATAAGSAAPNAFLASQRAGFKSELDQNPELKKRLAAVVDLENPGAGTAVAESLMNRMAMSGGTIASGIGGGDKSFYGPVRKGQDVTRQQELERDPAKMAERMKQIDEALAGSNITKGATDQGSKNDPNYQAGGTGVNINGERFNDWGGHGGVEASRKWREAQQAEANKSAAQTGVGTQAAAGGAGTPTPVDIASVAGTSLLPSGTTSGLPVTPTGAPPPQSGATTTTLGELLDKASPLYSKVTSGADLKGDLTAAAGGGLGAIGPGLRLKGALDNPELKQIVDQASAGYKTKTGNDLFGDVQSGKPLADILATPIAAQQAAATQLEDAAQKLAAAADKTDNKGTGTGSAAPVDIASSDTGDTGVPSAAGGLQVRETSLPQHIKNGVRRLAARGNVAAFGAGRLTGSGAGVDDGKGGQLAVVHPGEMILPAGETSQVLSAMSSEAGAILPSAAAGMLSPGTTTTSGGITTETQGFLRPTTQPLYPPVPSWLKILMALMGGVGGLAALSKLFGKGKGGGGGLSPTEGAQQSDAEGMADELGGVGTFGGGSLADLGGIGGGIPQLDSGGNILETGLAVVHAGETVVPSADAGDLVGDSGGSGGGSGSGSLTGLLSGGQSLVSAFSKLTSVLGSTSPAVNQLGTSSQTASTGLSIFQSALKLAGSLTGGGGGGGGGGIGSIFGLIGGIFGLESGGVIPSAAGGMKVNDGKGGTLAIVHPQEMVLPAPISRGLQSLISTPPAEPPASLGQLLGLVKTVPHFDQGAWEIDRNMVGMLHSGEQIIPSSYAEGLRRAGGGGPGAGGPSISYGDTHVHLSAIDSRSGAAFLMSHSDTIAKSFFRAHRNNSHFTPGG